MTFSSTQSCTTYVYILQIINQHLLWSSSWILKFMRLLFLKLIQKNPIHCVLGIPKKLFLNIYTIIFPNRVHSFWSINLLLRPIVLFRSMWGQLWLSHQLSWIGCSLSFWMEKEWFAMMRQRDSVIYFGFLPDSNFYIHL